MIRKPRRSGPLLPPGADDTYGINDMMQVQAAFAVGWASVALGGLHHCPLCARS